MVTQITAERVKQLYPAGATVQTVVLKSRPDVYPGATGTVMSVDDCEVIHIRLNNGDIVSAQYGEDYVTRVFDLVRKRK